MTQLRELYKCDICGNVVEIAHEGADALVCCGQPMGKMVGITEDKGKEKHVPIIEEKGDGITVAVGGTHHPMEEKHYIKFIEVLTKDKVIRAELAVDQAPVVDFSVNRNDVVEVRSYCNLHGLWINS